MDAQTYSIYVLITSSVGVYWHPVSKMHMKVNIAKMQVLLLAGSIHVSYIKVIRITTIYNNSTKYHYL